MKATIESTAQKAYKLIQASKFKKADKLLRSVEKDYPDNQNVCYLRAMCAFQLKNYAVSIQYFEKTLKISQNTPLFLEAIANYVAVIKVKDSAAGAINRFQSLGNHLEPCAVYYYELSKLYAENFQMKLVLCLPKSES